MLVLAPDTWAARTNAVIALEFTNRAHGGGYGGGGRGCGRIIKTTEVLAEPAAAVAAAVRGCAWRAAYAADDAVTVYVVALADVTVSAYTPTFISARADAVGLQVGKREFLPVHGGRGPIRLGSHRTATIHQLTAFMSPRARSDVPRKEGSALRVGLTFISALGSGELTWHVGDPIVVCHGGCLWVPPPCEALPAADLIAGQLFVVIARIEVAISWSQSKTCHCRRR